MSVVIYNTETSEKSLKQLVVFPSDIYPAWSRVFPLVFKGVLFPFLAQLYRKIYQRTRDLRHLSSSIKYALASLATKNVHHPSLHHYQQRLADLLRDRYRRLQQERDLHLSTMLQKSALAVIPSVHADITWHRGGLHITYHLRYLHTGNLRYLEESISLALLAVSELAPGSSDLSFWHQSLADSYHLRYSRLGQAEDLETELEWSLAAVESTRAADPNLPSRLTTLAIAYSDRYAYYRRLDDIDMGLFWSHLAVAKTPVRHPDYFTRQQNLAGLYSDRYQLLGNAEDVQKAIKLCHDNINGLSSNPSALVASYHNLAFYYKSRHSKLGSYQDLDLAIEYSLNAVRGSLSASPNYGLITGQCAILFLERYQSQGKLEDLETAAKWSETSVVALKDMPGKAANYQYNYAMVLYVRYRRHRDRKDLDLAVEWCNSAIQLTRKDGPDLQERQNLLTLLYVDLFRLSRSYDYLEMALNLQHEVVSNTPAEHPDAAERYSNLAAIYSVIYQHKGGLDHRDAVMKWSHAAVDAASASNPRLYIFKNALALQYLNKYYRLRDPADLDLSIKLGEEVLALIPSEHVTNTTFWQVMADAYAEKYNVDHGIQDRERAVQYFQKASDAPSGDPSSLWRVADRWARFMEANRLPGCLDAYKAAYRILPDLFWVGSRISSRHENLVEYDVAGITTRAIAACIEFKNFEMAVEFLEQSLSLTFQQLLDLQTDLLELEEKHPQYASMLRKISAELQTIAVSTEGDADILTIPGQPSLRDKQRKLAMEREELLKAVRGMQGFEHFLLPVPFETLATAAQFGPVIIINCSAKRCDALILKPDGHIVHVALWGVASKVFAQCEILRRALRYSGIHARGINSDRGVRNAVLKRDSGEKALNEVLAWIWQYIVSPVFKALEKNGFTYGRIWWCLTGPLTNLPLHAASPQDCPYVQSYTSTLSALIRARSSSVVRGPVKVFAIGLSEVDSGYRSSLPNVITEIEALKVAVGKERISVFLNAEATLEKVQDILPQSSWLHLACHGQQGNAQSPLRSGLLLYNDKKLELQELIKTPIPSAEFVFLSACETAMGDTDMTNESLHLAGGMIFAGFKAATGTLWAINDLDAPVVAKAVYSHLFRDGREPNVRDTGEALHLAVEGLRKAGVPPHRWVPFIHIGI